MNKRTNKKSAVSKRKKTKPSSISTAANQDIVGLLTALVQKLTSFEAKIDMILGRISSHPAAVPKQQPPTISLNKQIRRNRPMYKAVCADCGRDCEVPFKPRQDRQVYCKECFTKRRAKGIFKPREADKPKEESLVNIAPAEKPKAVKPAKSPKKSPKKKKPAVKKKKKTSR